MENEVEEGGGKRVVSDDDGFVKLEGEVKILGRC